MRKGILAVSLAAVAAWSLGPGPLGPERSRPSLRAQEPKKLPPAEPLVEQVRGAIQKGVTFLRQQQTKNGSWRWGATQTGPANQFDGATALALLALLNAGVSPQDEAIARGLNYFRGKEKLTTYVRSLQTLVFVEAGFPEDRARIEKNVEHLLGTRIFRDGKLEGWDYDYAGGRGAGRRADNSNTQYALLALHAARGKVKIEKKVWQEILDFYERTQNKDGSWGYTPYRSEAGFRNDPALTMTTAGLSGLLIAGQEVNSQGREVMRPDGTAKNCGVYDENRSVQKALEWISSPERDRFRLEDPKSTFYNLYGIERAGRLSGLRFFHAHDWYREGCAYLVKLQREEGAWYLLGRGYDSWETISTSFALLFLSKGRTPVLISKLAHGDPEKRQTTDLDWNNDRNDCRHLVEFASKELFDPRKHPGLRLPLAWQTFDMLRAVKSRPGATFTEQDEREVTADLLESPVAYFNGHKSPLNRFTPREKKLLEAYVEAGGFVLAEACCGSPAFDAGFRELCAELWPDAKLEPLPADHPVWEAPFPVPHGSFKLHGLQRGCKTVLIYSPEDLSCLWEQGKSETGRGVLAFRVGTNILAYATGKELPRPRLARVQLDNVKDEPRDVQRGFLKVAQLELQGDPQPAKYAMPRLMAYLNRRAGVDVVLQTEMLRPHDKSVLDFKFVYMHGRKDFMQKRDYDEKELAHLRFNLEHGGLLLADACCGKPEFDTGFRKFIARLLPKHKLVAVDAEKELAGWGLFSAKLNGVALTKQNIRCRVKSGAEYLPMAPALEGIKINGRWAVLYSRYDIGCALDRHTSSNCKGYSPESAEKIAGAAVLYTLRP